jgi:hypothetical protein
MLREEFIRHAEAYVGLTARPGSVSPFGGTVGYQGLTWSGSFIDVVARESGISIPACVYSPSGLAEFIRLKRWRAKPQPGDIVFFTFPTDEMFGMPHVGLVTDTSRWKLDGLVETIEAQTDSGMPKGQQQRDGVYKRQRTAHEILGFGRPSFRPAREKKSLTGKPEVNPNHVRPGNKGNRSTATVQLALVAKVGLRPGYRPGVFDGRTKAAYMHFQRSIGFAGMDVNGIPTADTLSRLGKDTGYFTLTGSIELI